MHKEANKIIIRYNKRGNIDPYQYSLLNPSVLLTEQEKERHLRKFLLRRFGKSLSDISILEIGCGTGYNLSRLIDFGINPNNIFGIDLIYERTLNAKKRLPQKCNIICADASANTVINNKKFDIILIYTVFSSVLDNSTQKEIVKNIYYALKKKGAILYYDFIYNNPKNKDVKAIPIKKLKKIFPDSKINIKKITLAPPLCRLFCNVSPSFYPILNFLPILRTHIFCCIEPLYGNYSKNNL